MSERLDRLEAMAKTLLLKAQQQPQIESDRADWRVKIDGWRAKIDSEISQFYLIARRIDEMQAEVREMHAENQRILDHLINQQRGQHRSDNHSA